MGRYYTHLTIDERADVHRMRREGRGVRTIARALGRSPNTISREVSLHRQFYDGPPPPAPARAPCLDVQAARAATPALEAVLVKWAREMEERQSALLAKAISVVMGARAAAHACGEDLKAALERGYAEHPEIPVAVWIRALRWRERRPRPGRPRWDESMPPSMYHWYAK